MDDKRRRPGGRTAQTRAAVFAAVESLVRDGEPSELRMAEVSEASGVAISSLYRRWGDVRSLLTDVAVERLIRDQPLPDTGSLAGDLHRWARLMAVSLGGPDGSTFFRVAVAAAPRTRRGGATRMELMRPRLEQIEALLERARGRGELTPTLLEVVDYLLAPLYMHVLFGMPMDEASAKTLVDSLLAFAHLRTERAG